MIIHDKMDKQNKRRHSFAKDKEKPPMRSTHDYKYGKEVLARWSDGLFYLGNVLRIDEKEKRCFCRFEDNSEYWVLFKDLQCQRGNKGDITCCMCRGGKSDKPNEIVLCDNCGLGYHQQCHNPPIHKDVLKPDVGWTCRLCVFSTAVKRGGALKQGPDAQALQQMKQTLPYDLHKLTWDAQHKTNVEQFYCYCGGPGDWFMEMLQCCRCRQWFHEACIQCLEKPLLYGDRFYLFVCSHCNCGPEYIKRLEIKWVELIHLVIFNLTIQHGTKYQDFYDDILPFISNNWENLQLPKHQNISEEERICKLDHILKEHKTRFICAKEIRKKSTLWGLRVRVPPPGPTIILPVEGPINDEVMENLQMKGKKTKSFVPIDISSPVPLSSRRKSLEIHGSIAFKNSKRKTTSLDSSKVSRKSVESSNQSYKGSNGQEKHVASHTTKKPPRCTLDRIIPFPSDFEGSNHPFKTVLERNREIHATQLKTDILNYYSDCSQTSEMDTDDDLKSQISINSTESSSTCYSPINGLNGVSKVNLTPAVEILSRKRGRKRKWEQELIDSSKQQELEAEKLRRSTRRKTPFINNAVDSATINAVKSKEISFQQLKNSVKHYFGAASRLAQGEKFDVVAKRVTPSGKVDYLVEWEGFSV